MNNLANATDETLVALYAKGVNEAFDTLLYRHKDRLYTYILYTVRNAELAEDIFQETFAKAIVTMLDGMIAGEEPQCRSFATRLVERDST